MAMWNMEFEDAEMQTIYGNTMGEDGVPFGTDLEANSPIFDADSAVNSLPVDGDNAGRPTVGFDPIAITLLIATNE